MKTTFVAAKGLVIDSKKVGAGETLFTVESEFPLERMFAGVGNGAAVTAEQYAQVAKSAAAG